MGGLGDLAGSGDKAPAELAMGIASKLGKQLEKKKTQKQIASVLQGANKGSVMGMAMMAGVPMEEGTAERLVRVANMVTEKRLAMGVKWSKRFIKVMKVVRRVLKLLTKWKFLFVYFVLFKFARRAGTENN